MGGVKLWLSQEQAQLLENMLVDALVDAETPLEKNLWILYRTVLTARRTPDRAWLIQHRRYETAASNEHDNRSR